MMKNESREFIGKGGLLDSWINVFQKTIKVKSKDLFRSEKKVQGNYIHDNTFTSKICVSLASFSKSLLLTSPR